MLRPRGNRLSTATRPLGPRADDAYGARGTRKMLVPPQFVGVAPAAAPVTRLSLEDFAALRAALVRAEASNGVVSDLERARIVGPYGLDPATEKTESAAWNARFKEDRFLFADYMQIFTRLRADDDADSALARRLSAARAAEQDRQAKVPRSPYSD